MLDVHAPHKPLTGAKETLVHLFVITLGLLIATQIEACQEWRSHVRLAREARASLRAEIEHNLRDLEDAQTQMKSWRAEVEHNLAFMQRIQAHPNDPALQQGSLSVNFHESSLRDTAWKTAQATGALSYMPYDEAERYAGIYRDQEQMLAAVGRPEEDVAVILGMLRRFNWSDTTPITREQASEMAGKLGEMKVHILTSDLLLRKLVDADQAYLQNRRPQESFHENF